MSPAAQQLVEIARALATGCRVLVLDEPTSSLSHHDVQRLFELIKRLKQQGLAIVYISHFIEEVKQVSDRFVVLRDGRNAGEGVTSDAPPDRIVGLMVGRTLEDLYPRRSREIGRASSRGEAGSSADRLDPATFTLHRGEIFGIAGLLGAGRTRLLRALFGLERVKSGEVKLGVQPDDAPAMVGPRHGDAQRGPDRRRAGHQLNIADNMTLTRLEGLGPGFLVSPSRQRSAARQVDRSTRDQDKRTIAARRRIVGRQSAESRSRAIASSRC